MPRVGDVSGVACPDCGKTTKVVSTVNMSVLIWRTRVCQVCEKVFQTKEKREDLETFSEAISDAIVSHESLHNNKVSDEKRRAWAAVIRRTLKEYRDDE